MKPLKIDAAIGYRYDLNVSGAQTLYLSEAKALRVSPFRLLGGEKFTLIIHTNL